ncbi:MAG: aminotransferase class V-fold PLP-dependent enzyme [Leptolyngbya sp. PLA2]|nr:aminotransferase class V-fold PLP-dependent enzyme [Leptolyngbya sp. PL-A2]MCQ3941469.1 aminotransferase [cyanobacterium CYA1]MCZ7633034.1 aminotransferase class V-fold PLP-dependent enzyme [Phycisphaerales bacterium]MDL1904581.1 aminotransferase class V-fold PLP-dependent enzyme [Synechococcales cyanobacterium CNB]
MTPSAPRRSGSLPVPSAHAKHWMLDPDVVFLNHGSYGACPVPVLETQRRYRDMMEREPVRFFMLQQEGLMDLAREAVASLVNCDMEGIGFAPNVTQAVASVIELSGLGEGDEALANDHEYSACLSTFQRYARRTGARLVKATVPFPTAGEDEVFDAIMSRVTDRTRLALISHITSPTAMVFPVARLTAALKARGVEVLIDGAHAPGQVPVDVAAIAPTYYTANLHKWPSCPKGTAFLWVAPVRREGFEPLALSSRAHLNRPDRDRFRCLFDYVGTDDYTGFAAVPDSMRFMASLEGSWDALMARNHALALAGRRVLCESLGTEPAVPEHMLGAMATVVVPGVGLPSGGTAPGRYEDPLQERLVERHGIQVPVWSLPSAGLRLLRISAQAYNSIEQYEYLADALRQEVVLERRA